MILLIIIIAVLFITSVPFSSSKLIFSNKINDFKLKNAIINFFVDSNQTYLSILDLLI